MERVSVVITTYNRADLLVETVSSVLAQTLPPAEVIVVDDGSTDHTASALARFGGRVRHLRFANAGQSASRNRGIRAATGDLLAFVDDDDLWRNRKLALQVAALRAQRADWVYADAVAFQHGTGSPLWRFSQHARHRSGQVARALAHANFIPSPCPLIARRVFDRIGLFDEDRSVRYGEDWLMWLRIAARHPVAYVPAVLADYRVHPTSMTGQRDPIVEHRMYMEVLRRARRAADDIYGPVWRTIVARQCARAARRLLDAGRDREALPLSSRACALAPLDPSVTAVAIACRIGPVARLWARRRRDAQRGAAAA